MCVCVCVCVCGASLGFLNGQSNERVDGAECGLAEWNQNQDLGPSKTLITDIAVYTHKQNHDACIDHHTRGKSHR